MRTLFFGSHNSHPSHPIPALTVSSAHSILVPLAMVAPLTPEPTAAGRIASGVDDQSGHEALMRGYRATRGLPHRDQLRAIHDVTREMEIPDPGDAVVAPIQEDEIRGRSFVSRLEHEECRPA